MTMVYVSLEMAKLWCFSGTPLLPSRNQVPLLLHHNKSNLIIYIYVVTLQSQFRRNHSVQRCSNTNMSKSMKTYASMNKERESETPQILKIVVSGVTELLRLFSPSDESRCLCLLNLEPHLLTIIYICTNYSFSLIYMQL